MRDSLAKMSALNEGLAQDKTQLNQILIQVSGLRVVSAAGECVCVEEGRNCPASTTVAEPCPSLPCLFCVRRRSQRSGSVTFAEVTIDGSRHKASHVLQWLQGERGRWWDGTGRARLFPMGKCQGWHG